MIIAGVTIACKCSTIIGCTIWHDYCRRHDFCKSYSVKTVHVHTRVPNEVKGRAGAREQLRSMTWDPRTRESSLYGNAPMGLWESSLYGNAPMGLWESRPYGNAPMGLWESSLYGNAPMGLWESSLYGNAPMGLWESSLYGKAPSRKSSLYGKASNSDIRSIYPPRKQQLTDSLKPFFTKSPII